MKKLIWFDSRQDTVSGFCCEFWFIVLVPFWYVWALPVKIAFFVFFYFLTSRLQQYHKLALLNKFLFSNLIAKRRDGDWVGQHPPSLPTCPSSSTLHGHSFEVFPSPSRTWIVIPGGTLGSLMRHWVIVLTWTLLWQASSWHLLGVGVPAVAEKARGAQVTGIQHLERSVWSCALAAQPPNHRSTATRQLLGEQKCPCRGARGEHEQAEGMSTTFTLLPLTLLFSWIASLPLRAIVAEQGYAFILAIHARRPYVYANGQN